MRHRSDIDDLENLFDREDAEAHRRRRAEMIENHRKMEEAQAVIAAERRAEFIEWQQRANDDNLQRGYALAGVEPPTVGPNGTPIVSLALLLTLGWTIHHVEGGEKKLMAPPTEPKSKRERENS